MGIENLFESGFNVDIGRNAGSQMLDDARVPAVLQHGDLSIVFSIQDLTNLVVRDVKETNRT